MRKQLILALCVCAALICGCTQEPPETTSPATDEYETTEIAPATETAIPETEPEILAEPGFSITADGDALESGSLIIGETAYVKASEFFTALDAGACSADDGLGFTLEWAGHIYVFSPEQETVLVDHQAVALFDPVLVYRNELWLPLEEVCNLLKISVLEDPEESRIYCTSGILELQIPSGIRVPVLMYHAVDSNVWGYEDLFIDPEIMEAHLQFLVENGYDPIFFEDLPRVEEYDKPVIITVDDGYLDNYTTLYPLLQKYQVKATIFVVTSSIGNRETSMTPEMVKELSDSGLVSIQSHTVNHKVLRDLTAEEQQNELERSRLYVARMTGREPFVVSYPTGAYNRDTLRLSMEYYRFAVAVEDGDYVTGGDPSAICRYNVRRTTTMEELAEMVSGAGQPGWHFW